MIEGARFRRKIEHVLCNAFGLGLVSSSSCVVSTSFSSDTVPSSFGLDSEIEQTSVKLQHKILPPYHQYLLLYLTVNKCSVLDHFTGFATRLTQRVPLVEQKLLILPEHLSSPPGF